MGKVKAIAKGLGKAGKVLGPIGTAIGAGLNFSEGAEGGDWVRGGVKAATGIAGGIGGSILGAAGGPIGVGVGGLVGSTAASEAATAAYDRFFGKSPTVKTGVSSLSGSAQAKLPKPKAQPKAQPPSGPSDEIQMAQLQYKTGQAALGNQRALGMRNLDVEERLGLGEQYSQRAIAGTMANRDIVTNRDQVQGAVQMTGINANRDIKVTGLTTNRDIVVNRDQVRGAVDMTRLNTGRDIAVTRLNTDRDVKVTGLTTNRDITVNRDQVRSAVDMTRLNTGRDVAVTGLQERGSTDRARLATEAQKYIAGSGNLKTQTALKLGMGDQYTQRYIGGSGDKRTQAMVDIERIRAGGNLNNINASGANQMRALDAQMRASQGEAMSARLNQAQMQREMLDYQKEKDKRQFDLQQIGFISSMYA
jgi:hypothetical protein